MTSVRAEVEEPDTRPGGHLAASVLATEVRNNRVQRWERAKRIPWPLVVVLAVQVCLSARLIWADTAFVDEATYLYAGHQEIHSILSTGSLTVPGQNGYYQTYFSGSPVLYPIIGAIADSIGGLAAARMVSLLFMLAATCFLYCTTVRLYDRRAAFLASAVFAILGPTQFLGAFATYDAMALCLMALAAFLAVKSAQQDDNRLTLLYACLVMVTADAVKYAVLLFDPVIIGLCVLGAVPYRGWASARRQGYRMLGYSATLGAALLALSGHTYIKGLLSTTIARAQGGAAAGQVLLDSWRWVGAVAVAAGVAVIVHAIWDRGQARTWLCVLLAGAVCLAPLDQARIHTLTSLEKHVDFGAWFAAIAVGYLFARIVPRRGGRVVTSLAFLAAVGALSGVTVISAAQAEALSTEWPNSTAAVNALKPWTKNVHVLAEEYFIYSYYLEGEVSLNQWANTWHFTYTDPATGKELVGEPAYTAAIKNHYFGTIALSYGSTSATDKYIVAAMKSAGGYTRVVHIRYGPLWFDVFHYVRSQSLG